MSWTGRAAAAGALDGKIVESELGEVLIGGRYLSVRGLGTSTIHCVNYTMFFLMHTGRAEIFWLLAGSYPQLVDKVALLRNNTLLWLLCRTHLGLNYLTASVPGVKFR
jgi:hypothetical protein